MTDLYHAASDKLDAVRTLQHEVHAKIAELYTVLSLIHNGMAMRDKWPHESDPFH